MRHHYGTTTRQGQIKAVFVLSFLTLFLPPKILFTHAMADHGTSHHEGENTGEIKSKTAFKSSTWVVLILVGLFIAALNFIQVMSSSHEEHAGTEQHHAAPMHNMHEEHQEGAEPTEHHDATEMHHEGDATHHESEDAHHEAGNDAHK